jgi:protein-disulfide isomerase
MVSAGTAGSRCAADTIVQSTPDSHLVRLGWYNYAESPMSTPQLMPPVGPEDHILGSDEAEITLVEYGDFQCPHCGTAYQVLKRVQQRVGRRLRFVFRQFPITESHPHAEYAAEASEAVAGLGGPEAFWRMHDLLFENQRALNYNDLARYAARAGVTGDVVLNDLDEGRYRELVRESLLNGALSGVNGTPTLFIDGIRYDGPRDEETLVVAMGAVRVEAVRPSSPGRRASPLASFASPGPGGPSR